MNKLNWLVLLLSFSVGAVCADEKSDVKGKAHTKVHAKAHKEHSHHKEFSHEDEIKYEISFLAKKLLDNSGKEQITFSQEPYRKPFLGVCSHVTPGGVQLTCITPGHSAEAAGLRSGDLVVKINDIKMMAPNTGKLKKIYFGMIDQMKTGEKMSFTVYRGPDEKTIDVIVGELSQPGYTMTIRRK